MSYDISLNDPVSGDVIMLPYAHMMFGGTLRAEYDESTGQFYPSAIHEAWLNITYNYSKYYYDATDGDNRFLVLDDGIEGNKDIKKNGGIRGLYGKTGLDSISMLEDMITRIESRYKDDNGDWITTTRKEIVYIDNKTGATLEPSVVFESILHKNNISYTEKKVTVQVCEGPNEDYWKSTAGNAVSPLYKLIAMAKMRPDGVWGGD